MSYLTWLFSGTQMPISHPVEPFLLATVAAQDNSVHDARVADKWTRAEPLEVL